VLAPAELETILRANGGAPERAPTEIAIDAPILPHKLVFHEIDLEATVARFEGGFTQITDVATKVSVRHHEARGSLRAQIAEQLFEGRAALELSRADARVSADVKAADVDLGQLLARLGLVADLEAHVGGLSARWQVEGRSLRRWADTTRLDVTLDDGTFHLYDPGSGSIARIVVEQGRAGGTWHDPTTAVIEGTLDEVPIQLHVETESIRELANPDDALDLRFGLDFAEAHAELVMTARAPLRYQRLDGTLEIAGERLDKLGFLLDLDIPIAKPYSARGRFDTGPGGYRLRDATVRVGESELEGAVTLKTTREPPYLEADLHSPTIRLDDFLREKTVADPTGAPSAQEASPQRVPRKKLEPLISEAFLRSLDAAVDVEVDQVSLGGEPLGAGILQLRIEDGRLDVDPAEMKFESAQAKGLLHCAPGSRGLVCRLAADVERADFGAVARWLDPDSEFEGSLALATELTYLSVPHEQIMPYATGELSVRVWPTKLSAGVIDLWSTTLLLAVLPALGIAESSVNCLVGDFVIDDGVMHPDRLVLDTTRTRVFGEGEIDLRRGWLDLLLRPVAKRTQLLSLETPLTIRGPIADLRTRTNARSLVGTLFHMTTSVVTAPLNLLFATPPPRDGSDVCGAGVARNG